MNPSIPALVEPAVLRWARETIGLSQLAASRKIDVPDGRVSEWEAGTTPPTIAQLKRAAEVYNRSFAVFFLSEPPQGFDTLRDFRRVEGAAAGAWSPALHADYRRALQQREAALEIDAIDGIEAESAWRIEPLPQPDDRLAMAARERLLSDAPLALPTSASASAYDHLNAWTSALEAAGVMVMATARGQVATSEMRAFSLYFDVRPVIVVNGSDAPRGRLFSLLHEYAHLLLHTEGLCDLVTDARATTPNRRLEARCNALAAAVLMPREAVLDLPEVQAREGVDESWDYEALSAPAARFGVSAEAFLRRLLTLERVSADYYQARREDFLSRYEQESRAKASGGDWYRNTVRDLGKGYVRLVADAHRRRAIDSYTAASYLNVKVGQIPRLAETAALPEAV